MNGRLATKGAAAAVAICCLSANGAEVNVGARVVNVSDGDTVTVLLASRERRTVRLSSIDAPEKAHTNARPGAIGQPFADAAKDALASIVKGRVVRLSCTGVDRYERSICELHLDDETSVNREMVKLGWAWAYTASRGRYLQDREVVAIQAEAKGWGRGLWREADAVPPWEWRVVCWDRGQCR